MIDLKPKVTRAFDKARTKVFESGTVIEFLKPSETVDDFDIVDVLDTAWYAIFTNFRRNCLVRIAGASNDDLAAPVSLLWMQETLRQATHFRVTDELYTIDRRSTPPPLGADVTWQVFGDRLTKRGNYTVL